MTDEKSLLEEILDVKNKKIKNGLLESDDTVANSENEGLWGKRKISQSSLNNSGKIIKLEKTRNEKLKRGTIEKEENKKVKNEEKQNIKAIVSINTSKSKLQEKSNATNEKNLEKQDEKLKRKK